MEKKPGCIVAIALLLLIVIGVFAALMSANARSEREVKATLTELHSLGYAITGADMPTAEATPENAAPIYQAAFDLLPKEDRKSSGKATPPTAAEVAALEPALTQAGKASLLANCVFPHDWTNPIAINFKEFSDFKNIARALNRQATFRATNGDVNGAFDDIQTMIRMSDHIGKGHVLIAALVQIAVRSIAMRTIEQTVTLLRPTPPVLTAAKRTLALLKPISPKSHFQGELLFERGTIDAIRKTPEAISFMTTGSDNAPSDRDRAVMLAARIPSMLNDMDLVCLKSYVKYHKALPADPEDIGAMSEAAGAIDHELAAHDKELRYGLASMLMPSLGGFTFTFAADIARRRTVGCLLDALSTTPRPTRLVTRGKTAIDPFTGAPLIIRSNPKEIVIYSVGQDKIDDGGDISTGGIKDIIAAYPRPWKPRL
jgi:hypothetical protein